jgi:hypothetical protein
MNSHRNGSVIPEVWTIKNDEERERLRLDLMHGADVALVRLRKATNIESGPQVNFS